MRRLAILAAAAAFLIAGPVASAGPAAAPPAEDSRITVERIVRDLRDEKLNWSVADLARSDRPLGDGGWAHTPLIP